MTKIRITEEQLKVLKEATWNYHKSDTWSDRGYVFDEPRQEFDYTPYKSDSKYVMDGRDTGSFGSGTYFSTYKEESPKTDEMYGDSNDNKTPEFIKIDDGIYRVDFDLYKNLYRVYSTKQGDVLYTLLYNVNKLFSRINRFGKFKPKEAHYSNADLYQRIIRNAEALNLKCPSYLELTRMAQELGKDDSKRQSLSTVFMEYNGYNGVNVSGIPQFDNTLHGSVIYDLSKVEGDIKQQPHNSLLFANGSCKTSVVPRGDISSDDYELTALNGKPYSWIDKIKNMPLKNGLRLLKNYISGNGSTFNRYEMSCLGDELQKKYLKLVYNEYSKSSGGIYGFDKLLPYIEKHKAYYWVNYLDEYNKISGLTSLIFYYDREELDWNLSKEETDIELDKYVNKLMMYRQKDVEPFELMLLLKGGFEDLVKKLSPYNKHEGLIKEDKEGRNMAKARQVVKRYDGFEKVSKTPQEIITIVRNLVPNSRLNDCQYLPYATHCYMESELVDPKISKVLNEIIPIMVEKGYIPYVSDDAENIDMTETVIDLMKKFSSDISNYYDSLRNETDESNYEENKHTYNIYYIPDFKTAQQYNRELSQWCIVEDEDDWDLRVKREGNTCYFCIRDDFDNPEKDSDDFNDRNFLIGNYALSAICVIVDSFGNPQSITTRLNSTHVDQQGHAITPKLLSQIIGENFYDVFPSHDEDEE